MMAKMKEKKDVIISEVTWHMRIINKQMSEYIMKLLGERNQEMCVGLTREDIITRGSNMYELSQIYTALPDQ